LVWRILRYAALFLAGVLLIVITTLAVSFFSGRHTLEFNGSIRSYHLYIPTSYDASQPVPLVLMFHMRSGFGWLMQEISNFNAVAESGGFIVVYPDGVGNSWADGRGISAADQAGVDDVAFTAALIDHLSEQYAIDLGRVYAAGFSNGGMLALRLACELPDRITAVAAVSSSMPQSVQAACHPGRAIPVLMMNGTADDVIPLNGKTGLVSVSEALLTWVDIGGCDPVPVVDDIDPADDGTVVRFEIFRDCQDEIRIWHYVINDGGHRWPGSASFWQFVLSGRMTRDIDASAEIWSFFQSYTLEPAYPQARTTEPFSQWGSGIEATG